jgi:uracil-DNA glycosylase family 4
VVDKIDFSRPDQGLSTRKHSLAECERCPLAGKAGAYAPPETNGNRFVVVGEAPGTQEARHGRPFIGPSGQLLEAVLRHYGIGRSELHLTNAALCRPRDGGTPPAAAVQACNGRLVEELKQVGASTVFALGNTAAQALLDTKLGITQLRIGPGRISEKLPGVRIVPSVHPAACLRQPDMFPHLDRDASKLVNEPPEWKPPSYRVWDDTATALDGLATLKGMVAERPLVVDIEVGIDGDMAFVHPNNYQPLCIGLAWAADKAVVLGEHAITGPGSDAVLRELAQLFRVVKLRNQNIKFDYQGMWYFFTEPKTDMDSMLASYCLDERRGIHDLGAQGIELLGAPDWKNAIHRYTKGGSYAQVPRPKLYEYNAYDVCVTYALCDLYEKRLEAETPDTWPWEHLNLPRRTLRDLHDMLCKAGDQLLYVELNGITIDRAYNDQLTMEYLEVLAPIEERMVEIAGNGYDPKLGFNPRSPKQVKEFYANKGIRVPIKRNQKGEMKESTDEDSLGEILSRLTPDSQEASFTRTLLEHRRHSKLYSTYVKGIRKRMYRGRVFPTFLLHGTTTGRLACRNPNLQNIPRESRIRKQFVPSKADNVFVGVDYSQAELRVLTFLAQEPYFRDVFNVGRDLFDELRPILYPHLTPAKVESMLYDPFATEEEIQKNKEHLKDLRVRIKAYVYGLSYGREEYSIAMEFGIPVEEAKAGMDRFFDVIPEIVKFRQQVQQDVLSGKDLVTPFGRCRRYGLITNENKNDVLKEALAFYPQSTSSDLCLTAFTRLRPMLRGKAFIRNLIHDSLLIECHKDDAEMVGQVTSDVMIEVAQELVQGYVDFATEVSIGDNWGAC